MADYAHELAAGAGDGLLVAGIDEVGRGPLAGPVVAAAVIFAAGLPPVSLARRLDDSKRVSAAERARLAPMIRAVAHVGIGTAEVAEVDELNVLQASLLAMRRAVEALGVRPAAALVDGNRAPGLRCRTQTIVGGDAASLSIAAASIVAKVTRDGLMTALATRYPGYGWERNAGYGTAEHRAAIRLLGVTPQHRRSFRPISELLTVNI